MRSAPAFALPLVLLWWLAGPPADAQVRPIYDRGAAGLVQALQRLQTTASALHTGAHPDDEDSAFIARVARGDHARVAYLSLNRGEGGQNIIGPELFDALGVIRTEELLQARRLDGGDQFFTRAFDFGFSKTLEETAARWHEPDVLADMVRVIRTFRPLVVYSRFTGTTADGHGHHQFAGYLTPLAVAAAADPDAFPDQIAEGLHPWQAFKFYRGIGFRADPSAATLALATGVLDPVIGRTYAAIAAEGRSLHRSQQMGALELHGPLATGLRLIESRVPAPSEEASVFAGIDTTLPGIAVLAGLPPGTLRTELLAVESAARSALDLYRPLEPRRVVPPLVAGLRATRDARTALAQAPLPAQPRAEADFLLARKEAEFSDALARAAGVVVDPLADAETVVQGGTIGVTIRTFLDDAAPVRVTAARLEAPAGWTIHPAAAAAASQATREAPAHATRLEVTTPSDATPTQPYFLERPRPGDMYAWSPDAPNGLPFAPSLLQAHVVLDIGGAEIAVVRPVQYRFADGVLGEQRRDVHVVPALTVGLDSPLVIVPTGPAPSPHRVVVRVENQSSAGADGTLRLHAPSGWQVDPAEAPFSLDARGEQAAAVFTVTAPAGRTPGRMDLRAEATVPGRTFTHDMRTIAYPHIQTHRTYHPAAADVQVFDLEVAPVRVGYVMGSGDQVPDALRRMGVDVTLIDADHLAIGDLSRFDTIVVGIRASETRPDFVASHDRLLTFVRDGGTLIVQYQQTDYPGRGLPPFPAQSPANIRVTDETAPVRILAPEHQVFTYPNRITSADFEGWVQERNLYAFAQFDDRYVPLLESADPGEAPQRGGQLYAPLGRGHYVYTSYAWFRQLPAGVPGAYRQFANLISLGHEVR
jgi:LmbE family N-acetylglucosaminyl deacetylase